MTLLRDEVRVARKFHQCDAWHWFCQAALSDHDFDRDDLLVIEAVRADKGKITPGTRYIYQVSTGDEGFQDFKARLDMDRICQKYELYPEE